MFIVEELDLAGAAGLQWEPIESGWEFSNPTPEKEYACLVAKTLALRTSGDSHLRVVDERDAEVIAVYAVEKRLVKFENYGIGSEPVTLDTLIPQLCELKESGEVHE